MTVLDQDNIHSGDTKKKRRKTNKTHNSAVDLTQPLPWSQCFVAHFRCKKTQTVARLGAQHFRFFVAFADVIFFVKPAEATDA